MSLLEDDLVITVLKKSKDEWQKFEEDYIKENSRIEISQLYIEEKNMEGYNFINCDFRGAIITDVNFDTCKFINCRFFGCTFKLLSLVGIEVEHVHLQDVEFLNCTIRQASLSDSTIEDGNFERGSISNSKISHFNATNYLIKNCRINHVTIMEISLEKCKISECEFTEIIGTYAKCKDSEMTGCIYQNIECEAADIQGGKIDNCMFSDIQCENSKLVNVSISNKSVERVCFNYGKIINIDLEKIGIEKIGLMQTTVIDCKWPKQTYKVSFWGKYIPSPYLLYQPVEDLIGVPPKLRNVIQKAQLVEATHVLCDKTYKKVWLWFWGITTEYGRSLVRLTIICLSMIVLMIGCFMLCYPLEELHTQFFRYLADASWNVSLNFIGVSEATSEPVLYSGQNVLLILDRILGIIFMGLWIGIATNKIGTID